MKNLLSTRTPAILNEMASLSVSHVVRDLLGEAHHGKGAYFRAFLFKDSGVTSPDYRDLVPLYDSWVGGDANRDRESLFQMCSFEKPVRLANNFSVNQHVSSYQSRVHDQFYAGAIMFHCVIPELGTEPLRIVFSFSGLPEMGDEAASLLTAERMHLRCDWQVKLSDLTMILKISNNSIYRGQLMAA